MQPALFQFNIGRKFLRFVSEGSYQGIASAIPLTLQSTAPSGAALQKAPHGESANIFTVTNDRPCGTAEAVP
jgi:hypothetical protein